MEHINRTEPPTRAKRIAVVVPRYGLLGGGEKFVFELTERLAQESRWQIHVFANRWHQGSQAVHFHSVPIVTFPRFAAPLSFALFARKKIRRLGVDLIHTHERIFQADVYSVHGIPHTLWAHQIRGKKHLSLFDHALAYTERRLINDPRCRHLLPVSSITAEKLQQAFGDLAGRLRIVAPGIDTTPFARWPKPQCRHELRERFGWAAEDLILLFVGMNFEVKGLDSIIKAAAQIRRSTPTLPLRLLVVGKGNIRKYTALSTDLGIGDRVAFTGPIASEIERIYLGSDIFALMSHFDTFGLVVLEAMAAGLPVLVSAHVGAKDVVRPGLNGYVIEPGSGAALSESIRSLFQHEVRDRMGREALRTAAACSWQATADKAGEVYRKALRIRGEAIESRQPFKSCYL